MLAPLRSAILPALTGADVTYSGTASIQTSAPAPAQSAVSRPPTSQKLRVRRSAFLPEWAIPPRVLLVDDNEVNRRMSGKFFADVWVYDRCCCGGGFQFDIFPRRKQLEGCFINEQGYLDIYSTPKELGLQAGKMVLLNRYSIISQ
jgi:hypothetical protein